MKQKVRMLSTERGVDDGEIRPACYMEGEEYEIGPELLQSFIELGAIEMADQSGQKSQGNAPSNKMMKCAPQNKSK